MSGLQDMVPEPKLGDLGSGRSQEAASRGEDTVREPSSGVLERLQERVEQARAASPSVFGRECYFPLADVMALLAIHQTVSGALAFLKGHVANYEAVADSRVALAEARVEAARAPRIAPNGVDLTPNTPLGEPVRLLVDVWFTTSGGVRMWKQVRPEDAQ